MAYAESAAAGATPLEIVQTRELTLGEAKAVSGLAMQHHMRGFRRDFWHWPLRLVSCGSFGIIVGSAVTGSFELSRSAPAISWAVLAAVFLLFASGFAYRARHSRFVALGNKSGILPGDRHALTDSGYTVERSTQKSFVSWNGITGVERTPDLAVFSTSPVHHWIVVKAAFENQDVDGFYAELERRWKQARGGQA